MSDNVPEHGQEFDLACGYIDEDGKIHDTVELRPMRGAEEDIMASGSEDGANTMNRIMSRCIVSLGGIDEDEQIKEIVPNLTVGDRSIILIRLRQISVKDEYVFKVPCDNNNCREKNTATLYMSELGLNKMEDPEKRQWEMELPSGTVATMKVPTGEDMDKIQRSIQRKKKQTGDPSAGDESEMSYMLLARVKELDGQEAGLMDMKDLIYKDRVKLRNYMRDGEPGIDTSVELDCFDCGQEIRGNIDPSDEEFFFPSEI